jgi:hypothetical protein
MTRPVVPNDTQLPRAPSEAPRPAGDSDNQVRPANSLPERGPSVDELGRNYRFFAGWRHLAFAGGAAIWLGVISVAGKNGLESPVFTLTALVAAFGQLILLLIDGRTHELILAAQKRGVDLEPKGYFEAVDDKRNWIEKLKDLRWPTHTFIGRLFYLGSAIILFLLA